MFGNLKNKRKINNLTKVCDNIGNAISVMETAYTYLTGEELSDNKIANTNKVIKTQAITIGGNLLIYINSMTKGTKLEKEAFTPWIFDEFVTIQIIPEEHKKACKQIIDTFTIAGETHEVYIPENYENWINNYLIGGKAMIAYIEKHIDHCNAITGKVTDETKTMELFR